MLIYMISSSESLYFFYSLAAPVLSATSKLKKKHRNLIKLNKKHLTHLQTLLSGVRKTSVFG